MEKLDRLGWAAGLAFTAYGVSVGVRVSDPGVLERVRALLPPGWKPAGKPRVRRLYSLIVGGGTRHCYNVMTGALSAAAGGISACP